MRLPSILLAALTVSVSLGAVAAQPSDPQAAKRGMEHYRIFCANCHGAEADGNGPTAKLLKIAPTNLTLLARTNGGTFDAEKVFRAMDGRHLVGGDQKMPVFSESLAIKTVLDITDFLRTIQQ
jgi:mono/diheme cytochrome c family protein